jgi:hypothetical protein
MAKTKAGVETAFDAFIKSYQVKYDKAAECLKKDRETLHGRGLLPRPQGSRQYPATGAAGHSSSCIRLRTSG